MSKGCHMDSLSITHDYVKFLINAPSLREPRIIIVPSIYTPRIFTYFLRFIHFYTLVIHSWAEAKSLLLLTIAKISLLRPEAYHCVSIYEMPCNLPRYLTQMQIDPKVCSTERIRTKQLGWQVAATQSKGMIFYFRSASTFFSYKVLPCDIANQNFAHTPMKQCHNFEVCLHLVAFFLNLSQDLINWHSVNKFEKQFGGIRNAAIMFLQKTFATNWLPSGFCAIKHNQTAFCIIVILN